MKKILFLLVIVISCDSQDSLVEEPINFTTDDEEVKAVEQAEEAKEVEPNPPTSEVDEDNPLTLVPSQGYIASEDSIEVLYNGSSIGGYYPLFSTEITPDHITVNSRNSQLTLSGEEGEQFTLTVTYKGHTVKGNYAFDIIPEINLNHGPISFTQLSHAKIDLRDYTDYKGSEELSYSCSDLPGSSSLSGSILTIDTSMAPISSTVSCSVNNPRNRGHSLEIEIISAFEVKSWSNGYFFSCAIDTNNKLSCFGSMSTAQAYPSTGTFIDVAMNTSSVCAVTTSHDIQCWGNSFYYEDIPANQKAKQIAMNQGDYCAIDLSDTVRCFDDYPGPLDGTPGVKKLIKDGYKDSGFCLMKSDNSVLCDSYSHGSEKFEIPDSLSVSQVSIGEDHSCVLLLNGQARCFGKNSKRQTDAPRGHFTQIAAGDEFSCALDSSGKITCWGSGKSSIVYIAEKIKFKTLFPYKSYICGKDSSSSLRCFNPSTGDQVYDFPWWFGGSCGSPDDTMSNCTLYY